MTFCSPVNPLDFYFLAVVVCDEPAEVENANMNDTGGRYYLDSVSYTCAEGSRINTGKVDYDYITF